MINWSDVAPEHRPAYYEWHSREHMVGRLAIDGFLRGRRYIAAQAQRDFLVLYEVHDLSVLTGAAYLTKADKPTDLTQRTTPYVRNSVRGLANVKTSLGIGTGGHALTLRFDAADDATDRLRTYLIDHAFALLAAIPEIVGVHLLVADRTASTIVPVERKGRRPQSRTGSSFSKASRSLRSTAHAMRILPAPLSARMAAEKRSHAKPILCN